MGAKKLQPTRKAVGKLSPKNPTKPAKKKKKFNVRERKFAKLVLSGVKPTEAMRQAGYAESTALSKQCEKVGKLGIADLMDKMGLSDEKLMKVAEAGLEATRTISAIGGNEANGGTVDFVEVPDYDCRHKYLTTAFKLKGHLRERQEVEHKGDVQITVVRKIVCSEGSAVGGDD